MTRLRPATDAEFRRAQPGPNVRKIFAENGLYMLIKIDGKKYWRIDFRHGSKRTTAALGVYPAVTLQMARQKRDEVRTSLAAGKHPIDAKKELQRAAEINATNSFEAVGRSWHAKKAGVKSKLSGRQGGGIGWAPDTARKILTCLEKDIFPEIGRRPIAEVTVREIGALLEKVQARGALYTATRVREHCSQIFNFAMQMELALKNPAELLRRTIEVPKVTHRHAITDPRAFAKFLRDLAAYEGADQITLLATRLAVLTFLRSSELRGGRWEEIDLAAKEWRVPSTRMKMGKGAIQDHIVPLSEAALSCLEQLKELTGHGSLMFPAAYGSGIMSENTIGRTLVRMGYSGRQTLHGFRASGRSLLSEGGKWSEAALERQLDHHEASAVVRAYARSKHLEERRLMMEHWGNYVCTLESTISESLHFPRESGSGMNDCRVFHPL